MEHTAHLFNTHTLLWLRMHTYLSLSIMTPPDTDVTLNPKVKQRKKVNDAAKGKGLEADPHAPFMEMNPMFKRSGSSAGATGAGCGVRGLSSLE